MEVIFYFYPSREQDTPSSQQAKPESDDWLNMEPLMSRALLTVATYGSWVHPNFDSIRAN